MRNLALMWVLAACLLGCGGGDKDAKDKAVSAADTAASVSDTAAVVPDTDTTFTNSCYGKIAQKSKQEIRDEEWREKEKRRQQRDNHIYKFLIEESLLDDVAVCPTAFLMLQGKTVKSVHLQKMDSAHKRKIERKGLFSFDSIDSRSFQQKLRALYGLLDDNKNIDSVTALKIAAIAAAECYGSEITPFVAILMGNNEEHWMVYCFSTIPDNLELQESCYRRQKQTYEQGMPFVDLEGYSYCPFVFSVLISRGNGQVLTVQTTLAF